MERELHMYVTEKNSKKNFIITQNTDPLEYWRKHGIHTFPNLAKVARQVLCVPASSISSERLFSEAGTIFDDRRNRLLPKTGEKTLFLHHNMKIPEYSC